MDEMQILREEIDKVNNQLTQLFVERMKIAKKIGDVKISQGKPIYDRKREEEMLHNILENSPPEMTEYVLQFFKELIRLSKDYQENR